MSETCVNSIDVLWGGEPERQFGRGECHYAARFRWVALRPRDVKGLTSIKIGSSPWSPWSMTKWGYTHQNLKARSAMGPLGSAPGRPPARGP